MIGLLLGALPGCGKPPDARHPDDAVATEVGGRVEPSSEAEKQALAKLDELKPGVTTQLGGEAVVAETPYLAASDRRCRNVRFAKLTRLACRDERGWYYVPDVFGAEEGSLDAGGKGP